MYSLHEFATPPGYCSIASHSRFGTTLDVGAGGGALDVAHRRVTALPGTGPRAGDSTQFTLIHLAQLAARADSDDLRRTTPHATNSLNHLDDLLATRHTPEHDVLAIEMRSLCCGQEELAAVCVPPCVRHAQKHRLRVPDDAMLPFVLEFATVDALAARAIKAGEVAALAHEAVRRQFVISSIRVAGQSSIAFHPPQSRRA